MSSAAKPKSYTHRVIDAVHASSLPPLARLLLLTMAYAADRATGIAWHGQASTLAKNDPVPLTRKGPLSDRGSA